MAYKWTDISIVLRRMVQVCSVTVCIRDLCHIEMLFHHDTSVVGSRDKERRLV